MTVLRRLRRAPGAVAATALLIALLVAFLTAPLYADHVAGTTPSETHLSDRIEVDGEPTNVVSLTGVPIGPTWGAEFLLGADETGRDVMVRVLYGARTTLEIAFASVLVTLMLSVPLALVAGYFRGTADAVIGRLLDLIWSFPALLLGLMLGTVLSLRGVEIGPLTIESGSRLIPITVIGVVFIPYLARPLRGRVQVLSEHQFAEAARASGAGAVRVMVSELLPHLWPMLLVLSTVLFANAVVLESALSFLGAGVSPPEPSLGNLIKAGVDAIYLSPHLLIVPCVALALIVLSLSGLAEGMRRAIDPRSDLAIDPARRQ